MKKILSVTALIIFAFASCRGPLARPDAKKESLKSAGTEHMQAARPEKEELKVEPVQGGITISQLLADKKKYKGETVKIRGKVTKVNPDIMKKTWIHIQDGTSFDNTYDLTITSEIVPETGSIITAEGKISLNRDFGYGYKYPIIMEDAKITKE